MAHPGGSIEKTNDDVVDDTRRRLMQMLQQVQAQQTPMQPLHPKTMSPPDNPLPPPFMKLNGPIPFRDSRAAEPPFPGIPIGKGPPQSAFPMAPGPPKKIWLLEKEMIQKAQAAKVRDPVLVDSVPPSLPTFSNQIGGGAPRDQFGFTSPAQSSSQTNRVWQHLFPNARIGSESAPSSAGKVNPAEVVNMGLKQILGRVVDVSDLKGEIGNNHSSVRPPPGFENFPARTPSQRPLSTDGSQQFWDKFPIPFSCNYANKRIIRDLGDFKYSDDINFSDETPDEEETKKKKNKKRKKSKKRNKKTSESGEIVDVPPQEIIKNLPSIVDDNLSSAPNLEEESDKKRTKRKSTGKKTKSEVGAFESYLDKEAVLAGLEDSTLVKGEIRINSKNYKECYINDPDGGKDILISGALDRNRALEGDVVVVQIKDNDPEFKSSSNGSQKTGKVVYILEKVHSRICIGHLTKLGERENATLCPRDSRIPRLLIPVTTIPVHIIMNPSAYENVLFKAEIVSWTSPNFAQGVIVEELGKKGNLHVETLAILKELDLDGDPVPNELNRYLPDSYDITQEEIDKRVDLRKECIFTIDPETARDLDDAVSIKKIGPDLYEVGVHIADVTAFLPLGTPLDVKVSERATTIYLVDRAIHMLPLALCLQCSLLPGQDKYALSVIWKMDSEGNIKDTKFARTVIHSCAKLAYEHAQDIIEDREVQLPTLYNNVTPSIIRESVLDLYKISKNMTKRRFDGGALRIDQPRVCFKVNENSIPTAASLYELKDSNRLIEEFMLLANQSVAEYIHSAHPKIALLRRHAAPKGEMMSRLQQSLSSIGIELDITLAAEMHKCIAENSIEDRARGIVLSALCAKPMTRAEYYCNSSDSHHYALNIDMYTHFTSPIRRYCDIVVHRILCAALGYDDLPPWDSSDVTKFCRTSNAKKSAAKRAGEMSCELFTALYIREQGGLQMEGIVQNVISHALDVIVVPLALTVRVYVDRLPVKYDFVDDSFNSSLTVTWKHAPSTPQTFRLFSAVTVALKTHETNLTIDAQLVPPVPLPKP